MNRPALATAVILGAALATAGCSSGPASSASAPAPSTSASSQSGAQSYGSMLDLYSAVLGTGTACSDVASDASTTAKSEATCTLGSGGSLVLQTWRDSASRDAGVAAEGTALAAQNVPYCVLEGVGGTGLWSVSARGDAAVCADIAHKLGGTVAKSSGASR